MQSALAAPLPPPTPAAASRAEPRRPLPAQALVAAATAVSEKYYAEPLKNDSWGILHTAPLFWAYTRLNTTESLKRMLQRVGAQRGTADAELLILAFEEGKEISEEARFASKFADRELWYRREGGIDEHGNRKMKLTFWAPFAIAFDVVFTLLVLYFLYKAVRWALGRGGGAAPAAEAKGGKAKAKAQ